MKLAEETWVKSKRWARKDLERSLVQWLHKTEIKPSYLGLPEFRHSFQKSMPNDFPKARLTKLASQDHPS